MYKGQDVFGDGVVRIEVFPVDQRIQLPPFHLAFGNAGVFVILVSHAIAAMVVVLGVIGGDRAVGGKLFDLQIDIAAFRDGCAMARLVMLVVATFLLMRVVMLVAMPAAVTVFVFSARQVVGDRVRNGSKKGFR